MFLLVALEFVVLSHLFLIGVLMMALAAAAGVVLYLTRPRAEVREESAQGAPVAPVTLGGMVRVLPRPSHDQNHGQNHDPNHAQDDDQSHRIAS